LERSPDHRKCDCRRGYVEELIPRETSKGTRRAKGIVREVVFPADPTFSFVVADLD
jgi:hypothetical protein